MNPQTALRHAFDAEVEGWIGAALARGYCNFAELLSHLPGVYPCTALKALRRMQRTGSLDPSLAASLQRDASTLHQPVVASSDALPLPHPLDFEWRFAAAAANRILSTAKMLAKTDEPILLFGTPAVAAATTTALMGRPVIFLGEDNVVTRSVVALNKLADEPLRVNIVTASQRMPGHAGVVVVDPPWYVDFMRPMLAAAASACRVGGHLLISLLPIGTRPGAQHDRERIIAYLRRFGVQPVETLAGALTYDMPFFESNALVAAGIKGVPPDWRRSDLVVLRKVSEHGVPVVLAPRNRSWHDVEIGRMRLFISDASSATPSNGPILRSIIPGDILPTVSRRDSRRRKAQVWTSGNRIFRTTRPDLVVAAAHQAAKNPLAPSHADTFTHGERDAIARLSYTLLALASKEAEEHRAVEDTTCLTGILTSGPTPLSATSPITVSG